VESAGFMEKSTATISRAGDGEGAASCAPLTPVARIRNRPISPLFLRTRENGDMPDRTRCRNEKGAIEIWFEEISDMSPDAGLLTISCRSLGSIDG
jgi:hypothetical protein